ncbi:AAA family ATPase (plasmid) [Kovacikia minuta CCNUW1]|uniref:AAA family ATPase n=1 Tax=Kovacikia minuta TaxID=2931930 RepID=UPI001CCCCCCD|nr:AAA family ATPase [Kovacikia minuta]UBF30794.1 AAA family ATPase [Kovacikia minuta CCNUW1]
MKIDSLLIENFRGVQKLEARSLGDTIIIAGQNGSGKSCIFDAIRLLKSTYGGYQQNEWQHFFSEFAIQLHGGSKNLRGLFNDSTKSAVIECIFQLRDNEKSYIHENAASLLEEAIWQMLLPEAFQYGGYQKALFAHQFRERQPEVTARVEAGLPNLLSELTATSVVGRVEISPNGQININGSDLLSVIFTNYKPRQIGVIDFHGAQRHYGRETVQGINLSLDQANQQYSQHTLYNYNNKYNNVKSEMAGNFIKELLAEKASTDTSPPSSSLSETLKELFQSFFPEKQFLGPQPTPDGSLAFPVITPSGTEHDLDELSSGEKEILYGYLRIRSSAPRDSIILLDEPELHLNPRLIRGLPEFYRKHLGEALQNQLWLVTHSDALIREAVGKPGFNVFHMIPCGSETPGVSQLRPLTVNQDLEMVMADLVGDLAAYRPGGKAIIFEGGGDSDFDKTIASTLFRDELRGINLLSGSNKMRVKVLHEILERAHANGDLPTKFYAIVDSDSEEGIDNTKGVNRFEWDVYHIENYLLHSQIIADVLNSLKLTNKNTAVDIESKLNTAARQVVPSMLIHKMRGHVNSKIVGAISLGFPPETLTIGKELHDAANRSAIKINALIGNTLSEASLVEQEQSFRTEYERCFADGSWKNKLPGRDILKRLVDLEGITTGYEVFRNLIVTRMAELNYKPDGMKFVIEKIVRD